MMHTANHIYYHEQQELHGFLAYEKPDESIRPAVIVAHDWGGRNSFACEKAKMLAKMGYFGFALDMFGNGKVSEINTEKAALIEPLMNDRRLLRARIRAAFDTVKGFPNVDPKRIAVIGFCFGGLCALDLARSGASIKGVVSFHGLLNKPSNLPNETIQAKLLILHGYDDSFVKPNEVESFCHEMTQAKVDWQVHMYGNTQHAFTNPLANDKQLGTIYNAMAEQRSLQAMTYFLQELLA